MLNRSTLQNRFTFGIVAALAMSVLTVLAALAQAVLHVQAFA